MRIAVIGGLAAGPAAAAEAKRTAPGAEVVLFEAGAHVSVGACEIPYFISGQLREGADLVVVKPEVLERSRGIDVRIRHRVTALDGRRGRLTVEALDFGSQHEEPFDRFILATGARARRLGIPGEDAAGVFRVRGLEDATAIRRWLDAEDVRHVVVVGGGYIGVEMAEAMRQRGLRASILEPQGRVLPNALDAALGRPLDEAVRRAGVTVRAERPTHIVADSVGRVQAVRTDRGEVIGCQAVIVAVGVEPRTELAAASGVRLGATGAVAVSDEMQTSIRTVWACGDVVEVARVVDGRAIHWPLAPVGRRTARVAARNASRRGGPPDRFRGVTPSVGVRAFGMEAATVGLDLETARQSGFDAVDVLVRHSTRTKDFPGSRPIWTRLVAERTTGRLLGGTLVSAEGAVLRADVLVPLVRSGATARELAEDLDLIYNPPVAPAMDPLRVAARELDKAVQGDAPAARRARRGR